MASDWQGTPVLFLLLHENVCCILLCAEHEIQICFLIKAGEHSTFQGQYSETECLRVFTNPTWTWREALASTSRKQEMQGSEIWVGMENILKYPPLQRLHFLQTLYNLTISGGTYYFSPGCKAEHNNVCVLCCPPLPLNCNSLCWGYHLEWIIHEVGASRSRAVWSMYLFKMNRAGHCAGQNSSYVAENVWKRKGHFNFSSFFYWKRHRERESKVLVCYSLSKSLRLLSGSCNVLISFWNVCTVFPHQFWSLIYSCIFPVVISQDSSDTV